MKEIELCPFRTYLEVRPAILKGDGDITVTGFMPCLKDKCPAFYEEKGYTFYEEHCKRLEKG